MLLPQTKMLGKKVICITWSNNPTIFWVIFFLSMYTYFTSGNMLLFYKWYFCTQRLIIYHYIMSLPKSFDNLNSKSGKWIHDIIVNALTSPLQLYCLPSWKIHEFTCIKNRLCNFHFLFLSCTFLLHFIAILVKKNM